MNCEKCLALLDSYLDKKLSPAECAALEVHLKSCLSCADFCAELTAILECCDEVRSTEITPPNPQALWLRISNLIESEQTAVDLAKEKAETSTAQKAGWWTRTMETNWRLSLQQMVSAVLGIAMITSLLTVVSLKNSVSANSQTSLFAQFWQNVGEQNQKPVTHSLELESRLKQQQLAIEYWNQRVQARKNQWNTHLREAFNRNLHEIDQVVADYKQQLQIDPEDEISEEMLDSALKDKMELLREFSEL